MSAVWSNFKGKVKKKTSQLQFLYLFEFHFECLNGADQSKMQRKVWCVKSLNKMKQQYCITESCCGLYIPSFREVEYLFHSLSIMFLDGCSLTKCIGTNVLLTAYLREKNQYQQILIVISYQM